MTNVKKMTVLAIASLLVGGTAMAQEAEKVKTDKKSKEIIIRKNGATTEKMTIVVDGENVTINGKPVSEFKGNNIDVITRDGGLLPTRSFGAGYGATAIGGNKAKLGVVTEKAEGGAKITSISKESAAEKAGLKEGDVITKIGSKTIADADDLIEVIGDYKPNDKVDITYKRNNKESKVSATLGENSARAFAYGGSNSDFHIDMPRFNFNGGPEGFGGMISRKPKIGMEIQDVEDGKGAKVNDVDENTPAAKAGLKEGDIITSINGKEIEGVDDVRTQIKDIKEGDALKFSFKRNGASQTAEIKIPKKIKTATL
jgi:serine protease Do